MRTRTQQAMLWTTLFLLLARLVYVHIGQLDLSPDEAQYWDWSRHLDWSYATKPPLVAWLIALTTSVFGDGYVGVRFFPILALAVIPWLAYGIVRNMVGRKAALWAFVLTTCTPLLAAGGLLMTPDVPSVTLWLVGLYLLSKIEVEEGGELRDWLTLGVVIGVAGLAKPSVALFFPLAFGFLYFNHPRWLLRPHFWVAGLVALACQAPVLYWNWAHDWPMFHHLQDQADSDERWQGWKSFTDFVVNQAVVIGPLTFAGMVLAWFVAGRRCSLLWWFSAPVFIGFLTMSFLGKVQANWPVLGMATGLLLLAVILPTTKPWHRAVVAVGLAINMLLVVIMHDTFLLRQIGIELPIKRDPTKTMLGWRELGNQLQTSLEKYPEAVVITTRYQTASGLAFHTPSQPEVLYLNPGWRRDNQYDYWAWPDLTGKPLLYVTELGLMTDVISNRFAPCREVANLNAERGGLTLRKATVFYCENKPTRR